MAIDNINKHIENVFIAHQKMANTGDDAVRFWDGKTPYAIHPVWCGLTMLTETSLPNDVRDNGALALFYHDVLEDTKMELPSDLPEHVVELIHDMTFAGFDEEKKLLFNKSDEVILLKLFDKTSNLMDAVWMGEARLADYCEFTKKILDYTIKIYGELNITAYAQAIINRRLHV